MAEKILPKGAVVVCYVESYKIGVTKGNRYTLLEEYNSSKSLFYSFINDQGLVAKQFASLFITEAEHRCDVLKTIIHDN